MDPVGPLGAGRRLDCAGGPRLVFGGLEEDCTSYFSTKMYQLQPETLDFASLQLVRVAQERKLEAYSISFGQSLLYNNIFPKHRERLSKRMSELVSTVAKQVCLVGIAVRHLQAYSATENAVRIESANRSQ